MNGLEQRKCEQSKGQTVRIKKELHSWDIERKFSRDNERLTCPQKEEKKKDLRKIYKKINLFTLSKNKERVRNRIKIVLKVREQKKKKTMNEFMAKTGIGRKIRILMIWNIFHIYCVKENSTKDLSMMSNL